MCELDPNALQNFRYWGNCKKRKQKKICYEEFLIAITYFNCLPSIKIASFPFTLTHLFHRWILHLSLSSKNDWCVMIYQLLDSAHMCLYMSRKQRASKRMDLDYICKAWAEVKVWIRCSVLSVNGTQSWCSSECKRSVFFSFVSSSSHVNTSLALQLYRVLNGSAPEQWRSKRNYVDVTPE